MTRTAAAVAIGLIVFSLIAVARPAIALNVAQADRGPLERAALTAVATVVFGPLAAPVVVEFVQYMRAAGQGQPDPTQSPPAGPSRFEMGRSLADIAERILLCFHPTGRFQAVLVAQRPWRDQASWNAQSSVLLQITWIGGFIGTPYQSMIAMVERDNQIRAVVVGQSGVMPRRQCELNQWIDVVRR